MEVLSQSPSETKKLAVGIVSDLRGGDVLALYGNLGSGKTTFVQGLVDALNIKEKVLSPTFVLVRHYKKASQVPLGSERVLTGKYKLSPLHIQTVNHIDLYRLAQVEDVLNLGTFDMFEDVNSISIVEWPEIIESYLPKRVKRIKFEVVGENTRKILM